MNRYTAQIIFQNFTKNDYVFYHLFNEIRVLKPTLAIRIWLRSRTVASDPLWYERLILICACLLSPGLGVAFIGLTNTKFRRVPYGRNKNAIAGRRRRSNWIRLYLRATSADRDPVVSVPAIGGDRTAAAGPGHNNDRRGNTAGGRGTGKRSRSTGQSATRCHRVRAAPRQIVRE